MKTGTQFAENALLSKWDKYSYDRLDCQAFVEAVLKDLGIRKANDQPYDWRGSNSMYRNYYSWRGTIEECVKKFGSIPVGSFVYLWRATGQEKVGYTDDLGDFYHVGIYCGNDVVRDSTRSNTRDGVGSRPLKGFSHVTLFAGLDYNGSNSYNASVESILADIEHIRSELKTLEDQINELFRG